MSVKMHFKFDERRLVEAVRKANYSSLRRAGAYIRATARNVSRDGRRYRENVTAIARRTGHPTFKCPVQVELDLYPPDNRRRDIDNSQKSLLDALTCAGVYEDDSLIHKITVTKREPMPPNGMAFIRISEYEQKT